MNDLSERLQQLGLSQYLDVFIAEGFDNWQTVLDITESDLSSLGVKLGHRRKLQRAIAESRLYSHDPVVPSIVRSTSAIEGSYRSDDSGPENQGIRRNDGASSKGQSGKRKYRRHPKPDENAPERPASAYVIFSNQTRQDLKGQDLSFTEIAKIVGERWQVLSLEERETYESQAGSAKEKYYAELAEYKKTPEYSSYQKYLEEFRIKHGLGPKDGKRSKLGNETGTSTRSNSQDNVEKSAVRRASISYAEDYATRGRGSARSIPSSSTSPATYSFSTVNSPQMPEHYSPMTASPIYDFHSPSTIGQASEGRERRLDSTHITHPQINSSYGRPSSGYSQISQASHFSGNIGMPHRRPHRESSIPSLTHEDTTLSSESGSGHGSQYQTSLLSTVDASKARRLLPQPIPTGNPGAIPPPLHHLKAQASLIGDQQREPQPASSLAVLLRAGELARNADTQGDLRDNTH